MPKVVSQMQHKKNDQDQYLKLHDKILEIPWAHKQHLNAQFKDVLGLCYLSYVAISIIHHNEIIILSSSPSLEFNLITSQCWQYDNFFRRDAFFENVQWDELYKPEYYFQLKKIKELEYGFTRAIHCKIIKESSSLIYSFATKQRCLKVQAEFAENTAELCKIGDFCFYAFTSLLKTYLTPVKKNIIKVDFSRKKILI